MHRSTGRLFVAVCLLAGAGLFAPAVRAQGEEDSAAPPPDEAAPAPARAVLPSPPPPSESAVAVLPPTPKPPARTGIPAEAGLPGWMLAPPAPHVSSGLDWHGNLELDNGYVRYSFDVTGKQTLTVYDSRGRFVFGPLLTQDLGNDYFLRETGQVVTWVREVPGTVGAQYQINADDVYVQVGKQGLWDLMAGRFLTWRVFRKGLGFDLYTIEDIGARITDNYAADSFPHMYEVNNIFMRDPTITPAGRAAFHFYPTSWSGIELVGSYGHLDSSQNVLGGRLAAGMKLEYFSLLAGAEYLAVTSDIQKFNSADSTPCDKCNSKKTYGAGGSAAVTPVRQLEIAFSFAYNRVHDWALADALDRPKETRSLGGYLQLDAGSFFMPRSLFLGGAFFHTEYRDRVDKSVYDSQDQIAASLAYPLGFNNAVVKLVFSEAKGHEESLTPGNTTTLNARMYSVRLRFAYYY